MKSSSYVLLAMLAIVGSLSISSVYAQADEMVSIEVPITVSTDQEKYDHDSIIKVQGQVANIRPGDQVTLQVTSPLLNNIVTVRQLALDGNTFETELNTAGPQWIYDGIYVIRVQYGEREIDNRVLVELTGGVMIDNPTTPTRECNVNEVAINNECMSFNMSGGTVTSARSGENSLMINIETTDDGNITLDPFKQGCGDREIYVLVDNEEWDDVTTNGNDITVDFLIGTEKIEFVGACIVPEFGTIAALILAVAIISIIAVSSRSRLSIMPKY